MSVFLNFSGKTFALSNQPNLQNELYELFQNLHIDQKDINLHCLGKPLKGCENIENNSTIYATIPLMGGKGGYGAKLKNEGGKKVRPNDNRFSRDAQGRRIEYQMAEKEYTEFIKKKIQEDQKVQQERQQFKAMQETMKQGHSFMKMDKKYIEEVEATQNKLAESIKIGREKLIEKMKLQQNHQNHEEKRQKIQESKEPQEEEKKQRSSDSLVVQKEEEKEDHEIQMFEKPHKKVKVEEPVLEEKKQPEKPAFISAKDKLKSLFKK